MQVQAQKQQPARRAKVLIAAAAVELLAPKQPRGERGTDPLPVNLVVVREVEGNLRLAPLAMDRRPFGTETKAIPLAGVRREVSK